MSMKKIYKKIAKEHGVTWQEVRAEMQGAIQDAYTNPNRNILNMAGQKEVECVGEIPTPEELIHYASNTIKHKTKVEES